ncbi:MAG TPA: DUF4214 domain-containing protein [Gemmataceae bacterium]|nr:DUF4214 domain-containing protein [Gemmataceae bacterium]
MIRTWWRKRPAPTNDKSHRKFNWGRWPRAPRSAVTRNLSLESLEERILLSTVNWINPNGGDWDTASNWSTGSVPGAGDDAVISQSGISVTHSTSASDSVNSVQCSGTLSLSSGTLSIANTSSLSALTETGGTLTGAGNVTVTGALTWTNGTMSGSGATSLAAGGTLQLGDGDQYLERTLNNDGTATAADNDFFEETCTFNILAGATLTLSDNSYWDNDEGASALNNAGTLISLGSGKQENALYLAVNNTGVVQVQSGYLSLQGGGSETGSFTVAANSTLGFDGYYLDTTLSAPASVTGAGTVEFDGDGVTTFNPGTSYDITGATVATDFVTANFNGTVTAIGSAVTANSDGVLNFTTMIGSGSVTLQSLTLAGGTVNFSSGATISTGSLTLAAGTLTGSGAGILTGSDTVTVTGVLTWIDGTMSGSGTTNLAAGGTLQLGVDEHKVHDQYLDGRTFNNAGVATSVGSLDLFDQQNNSTFNNLAGATLALSNDADFNWDSDGSGNLNNAGLLIDSDSGTTTIYPVFNDTGIIEVDAGTLLVNGSADVNGSNIIASNPGTELDLTGSLLGNTQNADQFAPEGTVNFDGSGTSSAPPQLEVMSQDLGNVATGYVNNFAYGTLELSNDTYVQLVDQSHNSTRTGPEALYTNTLFVPVGCTLDLNGLNLYARVVQLGGTILGGQVNSLPPGGAIDLNSSSYAFVNAAYPTNDWTFFDRAGQAVSVAVNLGDPNNPPVPFQPYLGSAQVQIVDASGNVLASATSAPGSSDVDLLGVTLPAGGTYHVVVSGQADSTGNYTIGVFDATSNNYTLSLNQQLNGQLYTVYEVDNWTFSAHANDQVQFNLLGAANSGIQFDLAGPGGYTAFSDSTANSDIITLPTSGSYVLSVHSSSGQTGAYAFDLAGITTALTLGATYQSAFQGSGQSEVYTVNVPQAGNPLLVNLADTSSSDQNELYLSLGSAPTRSTYQYRFTNLASADQQILVSAAASGTWYILVYGNFVPAPSAYSLTASSISSASLVLSGVSPNFSGTAADAHLTLTGAGFNSSTTVLLLAGSGTTYAASTVQLNSPTQIAATFTAGTVPPGTYTVEVHGAGGAGAALQGALTMTQGGQAHLVTNIILPNPMTRHIVLTLYVQYSNTGTVAMPAPLLDLTAVLPNGATGALMTLNPALQVSGFWTSSVPEGYSSTIEILASGATPGLLQPGESETVPVYYAGWLESQRDFAAPTVTFNVGALTADSTTPTDWSAMQSSLQPPSLSSSAWAAIYPNLTAQLGATYGAFVQRLDQDASYLGSLGESVTDVNQLMAFEVQQASGGVAPATDLSLATDMTVPVPGLPLSITRSYSSSILNRYNPSPPVPPGTELLGGGFGPFGIGWVLGGGWAQTLDVEPDGTVVIASGSGFDSGIFQPDTQYPYASGSSPYFDLPGEYGTLSAANGAFTLTAPDGQVTEFVDGQVAYIQDANGNRITAAYNKDLMLTSLTDTSGAWIDFSYNSSGRIVVVTNSEGQTTTYAYDASDALLVSVTQFQSARDAVGYTATYTYSTSSNPVVANALLSITNPDGSQQNFVYDAMGRLSGISANGGAQAVVYTYGIGGQVSATTAPDADGDGGTTTYDFDGNGQLVRLVDPLGNTTYYNYDANGNLIQMTDAAGQYYSYQYNSQGSLTQSTDPLGNVTKFTYGALATLSSVTDPDGNTTQNQYNQNGDLTSTIYADGTVEANAFNPIGELLQATDADGTVVNYTYNSEGQFLSEAYSDGTQTTFAYDGYGNLVSATNATGTTTLTYDNANRLIEIQYPDDTYLEYTYNAAGQRLTMTDQTGYTVTYAYNALAQLTGLSDGSGSIVSYTYDSSGQVSEEVKGDGTSTKYTYDAAGDTLSDMNFAAAGTVDSSFVYTYNDLGLCTTEITIDGQWVYTYDAIGQLTQAAFTPNNTDPDGISSQDLQYSYDAAGNRTQSITNGVVTTYVTNDRNEYTSGTTVGTGTTTYQYDANGNLISQTDAVGTTSFTYDASNRLIGIQPPTGPAAIYQYDALGNLFTATHSGAQTEYLVDPSSSTVVAELTSSGQTTAHFTYGRGLVSQVNASGGTLYYNFDALGSTAGMTNASGSQVNTYTYLPFGGILSATTSVANPFQYVGQWGVMAQANGLDMMGARFYDPVPGRFVKTDPIGINGGINTFAYAANNPVNRIDPSGFALISFHSFNNVNDFIKALETDGANYAGNSADLAAELNQLDAAYAPIADAAAGEPLAVGVLGPATAAGEAAAGGFLADVAAAPLAAVAALALPVADAALTGWLIGTAINDTLVGPFLDALWWPDNHAGYTPGHLPGVPKNPGGPGSSSISSKTANVVDPNALYGPAGYGAANFVAPDTVLPYRIDFENDPTATAPVQRCVITDQLSSSLDWTTFQLTGVGFGSIALNVPADSQSYQPAVPMTYNGNTFDVDISASLNPVTGLLTVIFQSLDPNTDLPPANVLAGFLPPEHGTGRGMGYVSYLVDQKSGLPTGTQITNVALVTFDSNQAIATDQVNDDNPSLGIDPTKEALVTIDAGPPASSVTALPQFSPGQFTLSWSGSDDTGGSGIATYSIFVSDNGGAFKPFLINTTSTSATFTGTVGHTYGFYSIATDNVGNVQATPATVQATTTVVASNGTISGVVFSDFNLNGQQDGGEPGLAGQTVFLDLNNTGVLAAGAPTATTAANGAYSFTGLAPGTYTVRQFLLGGVLLSTPASGSYSVTIASGSSFNNQNFGDVLTSITVPLTLPPITAFPAQGNANADYVEAIYRAVLDRNADQAGLSYWTGVLNNGAFSRLQVVQGIRNSPEHFTQEVDAFYQTLLGRAADTTGQAYWVGELESGLPEEKIAFAFLNSPEYLSKGDKYFVDSMYESLLGRAFDSTGEAFWLSQLGDNASGNPIDKPALTHAQVVTDFLYSTESLQRLVEGYYEVFLLRQADTGGLNSWVTELQQGLPFLTIGEEFVASDEFYNNAAANK